MSGWMRNYRGKIGFFYAPLISLLFRLDDYRNLYPVFVLNNTTFFVIAPFQKKLHYTIIKSRRLIKRSVLMGGKKIEENTVIAPSLKRRFTRGMVVYLYILLYLPIVATILYFSLIVMEYFSPQTYQNVTANLTSVFHLMSRPVFDLTNSVDLIARFFGAFAYFSVFTWKWKGQTPAKRLFRIGIVKIDGSPITFYNSLERASGYTASASIVLLGFVQYFWDRNAQTTHDKIAETVVIDIATLPLNPH